MNWFPFDMDAWNRWTKEFGHTHRGVYVTLLAWYYSTGGPLPLDWPAIFRIAEAHGDLERTAVRDVLSAFFDCRETGWHNLRADEEVTRYVRNVDNVTRDRMSVTGVTLAANRNTNLRVLITGAKRQQIYRDRKQEIVGTLRRSGALDADMRMSMGALRELGDKLGITIPNFGRKVTEKVTLDTRNHSNSSALLSSGGAREQGKPEGVEEAEIAQKSGNSEPFTLVDNPVAELCRRVKQQGVFGLYPSHPRLAELLALGVQAEAMVAIAAETVARGKGLAWMLATAKGRHMDQTQRTNPAQQGPKSGRGDIKTDRLRAWVPELVQAPQTPDFASFDDRMPHAPAE